MSGSWFKSQRQATSFCRWRQLPKGNSEKKRRRGGIALRSSASRNGPFGLCQAEAFGNSFLARIIHERFCCNRRSAATTSLRPAGSPLRPSPYCTSTHRVLRAPRAGLATRLSDFATNRHEQCGLDSVSFRFPSWHSRDGHPVPPANCAQGSATPQRKSTTPIKNKKGTGRLQAIPLNASPSLVSCFTTAHRDSNRCLVGAECIGQLPVGSPRGDFNMRLRHLPCHARLKKQPFSSRWRKSPLHF